MSSPQVKIFQSITSNSCFTSITVVGGGVREKVLITTLSVLQITERSVNPHSNPTHKQGHTARQEPERDFAGSPVFTSTWVKGSLLGLHHVLPVA